MGEITLSLQPVGLRHRIEHVDTDASGVVHFSRYASLIETATLERLEATGVGLDSFGRFCLDLRVRELRIRYRAPARFRDRLLFEAGIEHLGVASIRMSVKVLRETEGDEPLLLAVGSLDLAVVNRETDKPVCIPGELKSLLQGNQV